MAEPRPLDREEIRALVRQVVDATLAPPEATMPARSPEGSAADGRVAVAIGADHGGWQLKERIGRQLTEAGYAVTDCGTNGPDAVDYPDIAHAVARLVADGTCRWGIILDGAGIGSAMVANKVPGVRAANCHDLSSARNSREHNHANVLTLGAGMVSGEQARRIVTTWLETPAGGGRHQRRVDKITSMERRFSRPGGGAR